MDHCIEAPQAVASTPCVLIHDDHHDAVSVSDTVDTLKHTT